MSQHSDALVTIVIPTRNRAPRLRQSIALALRQTVPVALVIVDDASNDGTWGILEAASVSDGRIRVLRHSEQRGVAAARNAGLAQVESTWVTFLDDDDVLAPDKLRKQLRAIATSPAAEWACSGAVHVSDDLRPLCYHAPPEPDTDIMAMLAERGGIPGGGSGVLLATSLARRIGGYDPSFSLLADWDFYFRLGGASKLAVVDEPLMAYRVHHDSLYHNPAQLATELIALEAKYRLAARPLTPDKTDWTYRLILMAMRVGRPQDVRAVLASGLATGVERRRFARMAVSALRRRMAPHVGQQEATWRRLHDSWATDELGFPR